MSAIYCLIYILSYIMGKAKSRGKVCKGCRVKYGRWARLKKLTEDNISGVPSGLKGKVIKGDLLCKNVMGISLPPCLTPS